MPTSPPKTLESQWKEEARTGNAAGRGGGGRKADQQRPQQIVSGEIRQREEQRENQNLLKSTGGAPSSCHRQVDVWSKSVSKTHHGGGFVVVRGRQAHCITGHENMHQGPADGKLIKGPGSSLGSQSGGWSIVALLAACFSRAARSPTSSAVRLAADCWSRRAMAMASGGFQVPACVIADEVPCPSLAALHFSRGHQMHHRLAVPYASGQTVFVRGRQAGLVPNSILA
ncbi:hypothetical protein HDV63DRAFT_362222 [Trichoderma sp. SZMC 28014]